ncbi:Solute carrier 6 [Chamberlinius hualienensis]
MCEPDMDNDKMDTECQRTEYIKHMRRKSSSSSTSSSSSELGQETIIDCDHQTNSQATVEGSVDTPRRSWWKILLKRKDSIVSSSSGGGDTPSPQRYRKPLLRKTEVHLINNGGKQAATKTALLEENDGQVEMAAVQAVNNVDGTLICQKENDQRETWDKKIDFLLSIVGFAVDLANVWRFPFLCYRNGGGAFLIPYFIMLTFGAIPLFYMELILGQYQRQGPISVWNICPLFKGTGYCAVMVAYFVSFYYNVIIGWSFYFMFASFTWELPWLHCNNTWNTEHCSDTSWLNPGDTNNITNLTSAAIEYFERSVLELHLSKGVEDLGDPKWQLCLCVLLVYIILYLSIFKGVKSSGKVVWVTATMPYVILSILLVRGLLLDGAIDGIMYFIRPNISKLGETKVWVDAAQQVFYSVGVGFGVHLTFASYNDFHSDCYRGCLITTAINSFTSLFSGLVIFTYLGYMAETQNRDISTVATHGPGLVFQVYPEAIATLPWSNFWAFIFFFMLITLGMDSIMGGLESVITGFKDEFHKLFSKCRFSREIFTAGIMIISFLISISNLTRGGGYMLHWFDTYAAGVSLLCSALFETIGIAWFYGKINPCWLIYT